MLNAVMHVNVREIKVPGTVGTIEDLCDVARYEEAEGGRKVVGCADLGRELAEGDVPSVAGENPWRVVGEGGRVRIEPTWRGGGVTSLISGDGARNRTNRGLPLRSVRGRNSGCPLAVGRCTRARRRPRLACPWA